MVSKKCQQRCLYFSILLLVFLLALIRFIPNANPSLPLTSPPPPSPSNTPYPNTRTTYNEHHVEEYSLRQEPDAELYELSQLEESIPLLLNRSNNNIIFNDVVSTDLMPQYFDSTQENMVPQFEKYLQETEHIMAVRLANVKKHCQLKRKYLIRSQNFLYYFPNHNLTWCPVFKAGSTNWKQFFCKQYKPEVYEEHIKDASDPYCPLGQLVNHRQVGWLKGRADWKWWSRKSLKFLTARHPYERLVSVYNNKFKDCKAHMFIDSDMLEILKKYRQVDAMLSEKEKEILLDEARNECWKVVRRPDPHNPYMNPMGVTFREFVQYITYNFRGVKYPDFHWVPIAKGCDMCIEKYDVIEKFETLERDHHYLLYKLGRPELLPLISGTHSNPSGKSTVQLFEYFNTLDETLLWHLSAIYKDDFDLFGYKPHFRIRHNPTKKKDTKGD